MEVGVHPVIARLLVQRGLTTPEAANAFLNPSPDQFHDPFLLPDCEAACERLKQALHKKERILVHGDYDGDGVTSAALWTRVLRTLGGDVDVFVPHRRRDGYDMRMPSIEQAKQDGVTLIVTTDCGIQRVDEVEQARQFGIDVIVTDHHTPNAGGDLPKAVAVINPRRKDSRYPFPSLAGVGVAFKVCEALTRHLGLKVDSYRRGFLDLAAIGTVTDIMPLLDENRLLVKYGLEALQTTKKPGLRELIRVAGYEEKPLDAEGIGFGIGPRLNAAGRMDETQIALDLLLTKDESEAHALARRLNDLNNSRKEKTLLILQEAMEQVARQDMMEARCLVVSSDGWPSGLAGLVAGRITDQFHRPCIVIAVDNATGMGRGSARSPLVFDMLKAIDACRDLLTEYGGHAQAAGFSIEADNVPDFAAQMNRLASAALADEDCVPGVDVAMELDPGDVNAHLLEQLEALAPFGHGNHRPYFVSHDVRVSEARCMGKENQHLKLFLALDAANASSLTDALWWNRGELAEHLEPGASVDMCYQPEFNVWNGRRKIQFKLEDLRPPEW